MLDLSGFNYQGSDQFTVLFTANSLVDFMNIAAEAQAIDHLESGINRYIMFSYAYDYSYLSIRRSLGYAQGFMELRYNLPRPSKNSVEGIIESVNSKVSLVLIPLKQKKLEALKETIQKSNMDRERFELLKEWDKMSGAKHSYLQDVLNGALPMDFRARTANSLYKKGWLEIDRNRYVASYITQKMLSHVESRNVMRRSSKQ